MAKHVGSDPRAAHAAQLISDMDETGDQLVAILDDEQLLPERLSSLVAGVVVRAYRRGRSHALCELIGDQMGNAHPDADNQYVLSARIARPEERDSARKALSALLGMPPVPDLPVFPEVEATQPTRDRRN